MVFIDDHYFPFYNSLAMIYNFSTMHGPADIRNNDLHLPRVAPIENSGVEHAFDRWHIRMNGARESVLYLSVSEFEIAVFSAVANWKVKTIFLYIFWVCSISNCIQMRDRSTISLDGRKTRECSVRPNFVDIKFRILIA